MISDDEEDLNDRSDTEVNLNKGQGIAAWNQECSMDDLEKEDIEKAKN